MSKTILNRLTINGYQVTEITLPCGYHQRFMGRWTLGEAIKNAEYQKAKGEPGLYQN